VLHDTDELIEEYDMPPKNKSTKAAAPADELEELDDAFEELDETPAPAPKKSAKSTAAKPSTKAAAPVDEDAEEPVRFDTSWLATMVTEATGETVDGRQVRMLLRKMVADGELAREVGTDRTRYHFPKGLSDPTVKAVIKRVKGGEIKAQKAESLARAAGGKKKPVADAPLPEELVAPKTKTGTKAKTKTVAETPAKALPSTRKRK
jgi:hypothetical protein